MLSVFVCSDPACVAAVASDWNRTGLWCIRSLRFEPPAIPTPVDEATKPDPSTFEIADDWGSAADDGWGETNNDAEASLDTSLEDLFAQRDHVQPTVAAAAAEEVVLPTLVDDALKGFIPLYLSVFEVGEALVTEATLATGLQGVTSHGLLWCPGAAPQRGHES